MKTLGLDQLIELTGRVMPSAQARALDHLRIRYSRRRDGSLLVLEENAKRVLTAGVASATFSTSAPDFGAINRRR
jgi:hypothetical protein